MCVITELLTQQKVAMTTRVSILVENTALMPGFLGEHGLSMLIEREGHALLFDAGQGLALSHNAERLGVAWERIEAIVLSHGHYDHTGGLANALGKAPQAGLFMHPAAEGAHYSRRAGVVRDIGMPPDVRAAVKARASNVVRTETPMEVIPGVWISGSIPRVKQGAPGDAGLFVDAGGMEPDAVPDDQALWMETGEGLVVLLGCAHSGVENTLRHVRAVTGETSIACVIGGMHLAHADTELVVQAADVLMSFDVRSMAPGHCTGLAAQCVLRERFRNGFRLCGAGAQFDFT
ncbi:MAG: MBL fold metallo-hydrolase [Kiritimatiellae bacterium]|nr:MBL fold metallo-hydrolase [Kiritimatiellia bacterium]